MKKIAFIICFFAFQALFAQQKPFSIHGKIIGTEAFKYAYAFDNEYKLIKRENITEGKFTIEGNYSLKQRFGDFPFIKIFLSNYQGSIDSLLQSRPFSSSKPFHYNVIPGEPVELYYHADQKLFTLKAGPLNELQNKFYHIEYLKRKSLDSAENHIDKSNPDQTAFKRQRIMANVPIIRATGKKISELILAHPDSEVSLQNFNSVIFNPTLSGQETKDVFDHFSARIKESEYGKHLLLDVEDKLKGEQQRSLPGYTTGMQLFEFELPDQKQQLVKTYSKLGKYTLVDFWATWCGPCREETPNLIEAHKRYKEKGFQVITVSIDAAQDHDKWLKAIDQDHMENFVNLFNGSDQSGIAKKLNIYGIPANYLIDRSGKILAVNLRGTELVNKLKELYAKE